MAVRASLTRKTQSLNLLYKIPTDQFQFASGNRFDGHTDRYTIIISVDGLADYPEIPGSLWTVTLKVNAGNGAIHAMVLPCSALSMMGLAGSVSSPGTVMVEWKVRSTGDTPYHIRITPEGWKKEGSESLEGLTAVVDGRYRLRTGTDVFVNLTFYTEHKPRQPSKDRSDLQQLLEQHTLSDCTLICEDQRFPAHRAILAAQSPVFAAIFHNEMQEKASGICKISDVQPDTVKALLQYIYTRQLEAVDDKLVQLWIVADRYGMLNLCADCEGRMVESIKLENVVLYFNFALDRGLTNLKTVAAKYIGQHAADVA